MKKTLITLSLILSACATTGTKNANEVISLCQSDLNHPECQALIKTCETKPEERGCDILAGNLSTPAQKIELPKVAKEDIVRSPFINTQKTIVTGPQGIKYEFYYGSGGRYLILVVPPNSTYIDFSQAEATLIVDPKGKNPETLSLAVEKNGLLTGNGSSRNNDVEFILNLLIPASRFHESLDSSLTFKLKVRDFVDSISN